MSNPTDLILIGCLHERVNEQGERYLTGSQGLARFVIMKSDQKADDGSVIWDVLVQRDPASQPDASKEAQSNWHHPPRRILFSQTLYRRGIDTGCDQHGDPLCPNDTKRDRLLN